MNEMPKQFPTTETPEKDSLRDLTDEQLGVAVDKFIDHSHEYAEEDLYSELNRYIQEVDRRELPDEHPLSEWRRMSLPHLNRLNPESDAKNLEGGRYGLILEEAYQNGGLPHLPELEVFGVGEVDMEAIGEFSLELVDFIEQKEQEANEEEFEHLYRFGQGIHAEFFSASPSLINYIRLPDRLKLMTRATRSKVVQGTFGSVFVGETVYDVSFMKGRLDEITMKAMEDLSVPEKLDLLHQLRTLGAQAIANGEWSRPAYNQVRQTYETLMNSEDSAVFVQLAAETGLETLDAEYDNPQLSFVRFEGQTSDSRLNTRFSNEQVEAITDKFFSKYSLDQVVSNSTRVLPATKDALVCMDRSGLAAGIIRMDVEQFLDSPESDLNFDVNQYRIYKQHLDTAEQLPAQRRDEISVKIYHAIYNEYVGELVASGDTEGAAKVFAEILPVLSEEEWKTYFVGEMKQREYPSQNEMYHEASDENGRVSQEFVTGLFNFREQLGEQYEEDYLELEAALEHEDFEHAFEIASHITLKCQYEKQPTAVHQEVATLQDKVRGAHQANFEIARQKFEAAMTELGQTKEIQARAEVVRKIEDNLGELGDELRSFIEAKLATTEDLPQLELTTLKELVAELKGDESLERVSDEDVLLFQHVHSGELAGKIEGEFGFALSDLSLKEQYFFLNYLKRVTPDSAELMKRFTSLYGVDGMRTFLSLERGDETLGDHIVAFGQHDEVAGTVIKYYGELLNNSEKAESLVQEAGCEGEHCVQLAEQVRENIINRAQKDLETAVRAHDPSEVATKIETYVADAKVYVALLQEAVQQPLESIPAAEISEEDKEQIRALSARNYVEEPEDFQGIIRSGLESALESGNTRFYIERDDSGKVIFCDRFDDKVDPYNGRTVKYFGSVNAEPAFNGIGRVRITETLEQELANGETMFAHCDPENAVSSLYIEHGFVATGTVSPAGKYSFEIWRSSNSREQLQTKNFSTAELIEQLENQDESTEFEIRKVESGDQFPELNEGKYLTRYFRHGGEYYAVFESAPATLHAEFVPPQEQKEAA